MAQMPFLGVMPREDNNKYLGDAMREGMSGYERGLGQAREKREEKLNLAKLDFSKKKSVVDMVEKVVSNIDPEDANAVRKAQEMLAEPQMNEIIASVLGEEGLIAMRAAVGTSYTKKEASYGKEQQIDSLRADIIRGKSNLGYTYGMDKVQELKSKDDVLNLISASRGISPEHFKEELEQYEEVNRRTYRGKTMVELSNGKKYYVNRDGSYGKEVK